jgi:hypothetical protein
MIPTTLIEMCKKHDFLATEIKKRLTAQGCPPDMMELSDARKELARDMAKLVKKYLDAVDRGKETVFEEAELLYFNTWFNLHRFAEET